MHQMKAKLTSKWLIKYILRFVIGKMKKFSFPKLLFLTLNRTFRDFIFRTFQKNEDRNRATDNAVKIKLEKTAQRT